MSYDSWITSRRFWTDTLERVIRTTAQVAVAVLATPVAMSQAGVPTSIPWEAVLTATAGAAALTFLTALAGRGVGDHSTASLTSGTSGPSLQGKALQAPGGRHREG